MNTDKEVRELCEKICETVKLLENKCKEIERPKECYSWGWKELISTLQSYRHYELISNWTIKQFDSSGSCTITLNNGEEMTFEADSSCNALKDAVSFLQWYEKNKNNELLGMSEELVKINNKLNEIAKLLSEETTCRINLCNTKCL